MKIAASTIVESILAMLVLMISFGGGMTLYLTVLQGDAFPLKTKANNVLHSVFETTKQEQRFLDETLSREGLIIEKEVRPYDSPTHLLPSTNVYHLELKAYSPDRRLVAQEQHLIHVTDED